MREHTGLHTGLHTSKHTGARGNVTKCRGLLDVIAQLHTFAMCAQVTHWSYKDIKHHLGQAIGIQTTSFIASVAAEVAVRDADACVDAYEDSPTTSCCGVP